MRIKTMRSKMLDTELAMFEPNGYITAANAAQFQDQLTSVVGQKDYAAFLVDMSAVEFLDSAGLMALVTAFNLAKSLGKSFTICSIPPSVKIIFEITQLDRILAIYNSRAEFESSFVQDMAA
jgi:anti-sigma B factor antagonist